MFQQYEEMNDNSNQQYQQINQSYKQAILNKIELSETYNINKLNETFLNLKNHMKNIIKV